MTSNPSTASTSPSTSSAPGGGLAHSTVRDLMTEHVFTVHADDDLETVHELMLEHHVRHVPVLDDEELLAGLISHRDLLRHSLIEQEHVPGYVERALLSETLAREVMTGTPDTTTADTDIREAAQVMLELKYGCLPVVEGSKLVGILTEADFVRLLASGE